MKIGAIVPQGWTGEYDGWDTRDAWRRTVEVAQQADRLGFESIWLYDHFHTVPRPTDEITFESFTTLSALAALTERVRLGHIVICTSFRNPALTAKMISTMDALSGGRMELGIGAGWKRDEWLAYGYGFPETKERLAIFADHLAVIDAMLRGDKHAHATSEGTHASVRNAINVPKPLQQPRVPIMVGGNGPNVTWRLAARMPTSSTSTGCRRARLPRHSPSSGHGARRSTGIRRRSRVGPHLEIRRRDGRCSPRGPPRGLPGAGCLARDGARRGIDDE